MSAKDDAEHWTGERDSAHTPRECGRCRCLVNVPDAHADATDVFCAACFDKIIKAANQQPKAEG